MYTSPDKGTNFEYQLTVCVLIIGKTHKQKYSMSKSHVAG